MRHIRIALAAIAAAAVLFIIILTTRETRPTADQSLSGEIVYYDSATRVLTLRTDGGDDGFVVPVTTTVHEGTRRLPVSALPSAVGHRAKVWYRQSGGRRTTSQIRVSIPSAAPDGSAQSAPR